MIRKDHNGVDFPGVTLHAGTEAGAQQINVIDEQTAVPVSQIEREEPGSTWGVVAPVVGHGSASLPGD
jgi:hypothetical protein